MDIYISLYIDIYMDIYMDIYTHSKEPRSMVAHLPRVKKTLIALTKTMSHTQSTWPCPSVFGPVRVSRPRSDRWLDSEINSLVSVMSGVIQHHFGFVAVKCSGPVKAFKHPQQKPQQWDWLEQGHSGESKSPPSRGVWVRHWDSCSERLNLKV